MNQSFCSFNTAFHCILLCSGTPSLALHGTFCVVSTFCHQEQPFTVCEYVETFLQLPRGDQPASWWAKQQQSRKQQEERPRFPSTRLILTGLMKTLSKPLSSQSCTLLARNQEVTSSDTGDNETLPANRLYQVRGFVPDSPLALDRDVFMKSLKTSLRGSSPGPGGCTTNI